MRARAFGGLGWGREAGRTLGNEQTTNARPIRIEPLTLVLISQELERRSTTDQAVALADLDLLRKVWGTADLSDGAAKVRGAYRVLSRFTVRLVEKRSRENAQGEGPMHCGTRHATEMYRHFFSDTKERLRKGGPQAVHRNSLCFILAPHSTPSPDAIPHKVRNSRW